MSDADDPDWLPEEYDRDADLRDRLAVMADIEGGIELWVSDDQGVVEIVHQPVEFLESHHEVYELRTGPTGDVSDGWNYEIVVPKSENGDPFLRSADPDQDYEDYIETRTIELRDIDVRIYGIDHDRLEGVDQQESEYEYRLTGCGGGTWRRSKWTDYDSALEDYEMACDDWDGVVDFERREPGDDSTIQRKKAPDADEWIDVTEDMIHFKDEEVAA